MCKEEVLSYGQMTKNDKVAFVATDADLKPLEEIPDRLWEYAGAPPNIHGAIDVL